MSVLIDDLELKLIRRSTGSELILDAFQGLWTEEQYLKLTEQSNHLIEFTDGYLEGLTMPTDSHQAISRWLFLAFFAFIQRLGGTVFYAPLRIEIRPGKYREPDLLVLLNSKDTRRREQFWLGADLVVEIVSPNDPGRDTVDKVFDYAEAHIPEYWIVNPIDETITVLTLQGDTYTSHGVFRRGERATSALLPDFTVAVSDVFDLQ